MRMMAVDYGDVRTGVAFCDVREMLATAYDTVEERYAPKLAEKLALLQGRESRADRCGAAPEYGRQLWLPVRRLPPFGRFAIGAYRTSGGVPGRAPDDGAGL